MQTPFSYVKYLVLLINVSKWKNAFLMPFTPPLYRYPTMTMTASWNRKEELGFQEVDEIDFFLV